MSARMGRPGTQATCGNGPPSKLGVPAPAVDHALQGETLGGRDRSGRGSVSSPEDPRDTRWREPPGADVHEGPDERAHHLMEERVRPEAEHEQLSAARHGQGPEISYGRAVLTRMPAEGGEVALPAEGSARLSHRRERKRPG